MSTGDHAAKKEKTAIAKRSRATSRENEQSQAWSAIRHECCAKCCFRHSANAASSSKLRCSDDSRHLTGILVLIAFDNSTRSTSRSEGIESRFRGGAMLIGPRQHRFNSRRNSYRLGTACSNWNVSVAAPSTHRNLEHLLAPACFYRRSLDHATMGRAEVVCSDGPMLAQYPLLFNVRLCWTVEHQQTARTWNHRSHGDKMGLGSQFAIIHFVDSRNNSPICLGNLLPLRLVSIQILTHSNSATSLKQFAANLKKSS